MKTEELRKKREQDRAAVGVMLASPAGRLLLEDLQEQFDGDDLASDTVEKTYFNLGARHVARLLKNLRDSATRE